MFVVLHQYELEADPYWLRFSYLDTGVQPNSRKRHNSCPWSHVRCANEQEMDHRRHKRPTVPIANPPPVFRPSPQSAGQRKLCLSGPLPPCVWVTILTAADKVALISSGGANLAWTLTGCHNALARLSFSCPSHTVSAYFLSPSLPPIIFHVSLPVRLLCASFFCSFLGIHPTWPSHQTLSRSLAALAFLHLLPACQFILQVLPFRKLKVLKFFSSWIMQFTLVMQHIKTF